MTSTHTYSPSVQDWHGSESATQRATYRTNRTVNMYRFCVVEKRSGAILHEHRGHTVWPRPHLSTQNSTSTVVSSRWKRSAEVRTRRGALHTVREQCRHLFLSGQHLTALRLQQKRRGRLVRTSPHLPTKQQGNFKCYTYSTSSNQPFHNSYCTA